MALDSVQRAQASREPVLLERIEDGRPREATLATLRLGEPPLGALQLLFAQPPDPDGPLLAGLGTFAVRVAHALRASEHRRVLAADLDHTRALLTIVGQAIAELSLAHTLDTAVERVRELLVTDLLAVYPERGRVLTESEDSLLRALAAQLAVAVQNAQLHERVERESGEAKRARDEQAAVSRRLRALYEISRSFTEGLVDGAFDVVVRTIVEELGVDAAVLRIPHERGDSLVPVAVHVREERLAEPVRRILSLPQPLSPVRPTSFRTGEVLVLDAETAASLGPAHTPLIPFLDQGST